MSTLADEDDRSGPSREAILDAAEKLMAGVGYDRTSVASICRQSHLPVGSVYHHFGSKAGVLAAVLERGTRRFRAAMPHGPDLAGSAEQNLHRYWSAAADAMVANAAYFIIESDLARIGRDDPQIAVLIDGARAKVAEDLGAVIVPFAQQAGVQDAHALTGRLTALTFTFTRGAVIEAGSDVSRLRGLIEDLYVAVRATVLQTGGENGWATRPPDGAP